MNSINLTSPAAALAYLSSLPAQTILELPGAGDPRPNSPAADAVQVITDQSANAWAASRNRWEWTAGELVAELRPEPLAASFEIVFDNGGGATLQNHAGTVAIHYASMEDLARDVAELDNGEDPAVWDGVDPSLWISDEEYERHAESGGLFAIQLDPAYRRNWPTEDSCGWRNVAAFLVRFRGPQPMTGPEFAAARKAAGYSQESLAELLQVDRVTVSRWETGEPPMTAVMALRSLL